LILLYLLSVLSLQITPDSATVGDTLNVNIKGTIPDSIEVVKPDSFPDIILLDTIQRLSDTTAKIQFVSFSTGPQELKIKANKDTLKVTYTIKSVLEPENKGISPIWAPYGFFNWHYLLFLLVIPLSLIAYFLFKKFKKEKTGLIEEDEMEPGEEALANLGFLEEKARDWNWNKLYTSLSYIARRYIERKEEIPAVEATTSELLMLIKKEGLDIFGSLTRQFPEWDLIKFADKESTEDEFNKDITLVRSVIEKKEKEEEEKEKKNDSL
jgi:hypothetical protein